MKNILMLTILLVLVLTACSPNYPLELGSGYQLDYDGNSYLYILDTQNTVIINSHIMAFNIDSIFILVEQKPVNLILQDTWNNPEMNLRKRDKLFKESPLRFYWIINKNEHQVYGPYNKEEYFRKRKELSISPGLKLKEV